MEELRIDFEGEQHVEQAGHKVPVAVDPADNALAMELVYKVGIDLGSKWRMKTLNSLTKPSDQHCKEDLGENRLDLQDTQDGWASSLCHRFKLASYVSPLLYLLQE